MLLIEPAIFEPGQAAISTPLLLPLLRIALSGSIRLHLGFTNYLTTLMNKVSESCVQIWELYIRTQKTLFGSCDYLYLLELPSEALVLGRRILQLVWSATMFSNRNLLSSSNLICSHHIHITFLFWQPPRYLDNKNSLKCASDYNWTKLPDG